MYILKKEMKKELRKPFGKLKENIEQIKKDLIDKKIYLVGDICSINALKNNIIPFSIFFDYKNKRKKIKQINKLPKPDMVVKNKSGTISNELINLIDEKINEKINVLIDGEEDLVSLYLLTKLENQEIIIYGQPNLGIVYTICNKKTKKKALNLIKKCMEEN